MTLLGRTTRIINALKVPSRRFAINAAMVVMVVVAFIWAYLFVPVDILTSSSQARNFVTLSNTLFPWLANIAKYGPIGEKASFTYSVFQVAFAIPVIVFTLSEIDPQLYQKKKEGAAFSNIFLFVFGILCLGILPFILLNPAWPTRAERVILLSNLGMPISSIVFTHFFWFFITHTYFACVNAFARKGVE